MVRKYDAIRDVLIWLMVMVIEVLRRWRKSLDFGLWALGFGLWSERV